MQGRLIVVGDHARVRPHQRADARLVLLGGLLGAGGDHHHAQILHGRYHGPGLVAAGEDQHALAGKALAKRGQRRLDPGLLAGDQRLGARASDRDRRAGGRSRARLGRCRPRHRSCLRRRACRSPLAACARRAAWPWSTPPCWPWRGAWSGPRGSGQSPERVQRMRRPSSSNSGATFQNSPPTFHSPIRLISWVGCRRLATAGAPARARGCR